VRGLEMAALWGLGIFKSERHCVRTERGLDKGFLRGIRGRGGEGNRDRKDDNGVVAL
jgi:hypothetical protein